MSKPKFAALALLATGYAAAVEPPDEYDLGRFGEGPSQHSGTLRCDGDGEIVGLTIKAGTYVDGLRLKCSSPDAAGRLGPVTDGRSVTGVSFAEVLLPVASTQRTFFCPQQFVLSGLTARGGEYVDRITAMRCTAYRGTATRSVTVNMGGNGGTQYALNCRGSDRISSFPVAWGQWIDRLSVSCAEQPPAQTQSSPTTQQNTFDPSVSPSQPAVTPNRPAADSPVRRTIPRRQRRN